MERLVQSRKKRSPNQYWRPARFITFVPLYCGRLQPTIPLVKAVSSRLQVHLIAFAYAALFFYAALQRYVRYLAELRNPIDAQGGMWAFGDEMLTYYLFFLFLVPTFFLLRLMGTSQTTYTGYAKLALAVALTAPLSLGLLSVDVGNVSSIIGDAALIRLFRSPMVFIVLVMSRIFAREKLSKRLFNGAILSETLTIAASIAALFLSARSHS